MQRSLSEYHQYAGITDLKNSWCIKEFGSNKKTLNLTLGQYARMDNESPHHNRQVKMISGCPKSSDWRNETIMQLCLKAAKSNIKRFAFVGLDVHNSFFLRALSLMIGKNLTFPPVHVHRKKSTSFVSEAVYEANTNISLLLAQRTIYAYALYNYTHDYLCFTYEHKQRGSCLIPAPHGWAFVLNLLNQRHDTDGNDAQNA